MNCDLSTRNLFIRNIIANFQSSGRYSTTELFYDENKKIITMEIGKIKIEVRFGQTQANIELSDDATRH